MPEQPGMFHCTRKRRLLIALFKANRTTGSSIITSAPEIAELCRVRATAAKAKQSLDFSYSSSKA